MKTEQKLQYNVVKFHSQRWPERHGMLFEVNNDTHGIKQAMHRRALGMQSGVADLIMVHDGMVAGIELKAPGSTHDRDHISNQMEWGVQLAKNGGWYLITSNQNDVEAFMCAMVQGNKNILANICNKNLAHVRDELVSVRRGVKF